MQPFTYARADDPAAAVRQVADGPRAAFLAGGTNVIDFMKLNVLTPDRLVDINHVGLDRIEVTETGVRVGAMVRNSDLAWHDAIRRGYPVLSEALLSGATASSATWRRPAATSCSERGATTSATRRSRATSANLEAAAARSTARTEFTPCLAAAIVALRRIRPTCACRWSRSTPSSSPTVRMDRDVFRSRTFTYCQAIIRSVKPCSRPAN